MAVPFASKGPELSMAQLPQWLSNISEYASSWNEYTGPMPNLWTSG
jgi:hypothetical protein